MSNGEIVVKAKAGKKADISRINYPAASGGEFNPE